MAQSPSPATGEAATRALASVAAGLLLALALAPALIVGTACAFALRRYRLRFTWALAATPPLAIPLALAPVSAVSRLRGATDRLLDGQVALLELAVAGCAFWLPLAALIATGCKLWHDRRDRLHGGAAEQASRSALGPVQTLQLRRARIRARQVGRYGDTGILVGHDHVHRRPIRVPLMQAHGTIVGGSNTGKTNTAEVLLEGAVAAGCGFVILDGKGGRDLPRTAGLLAAKYQRPLALWSILPYGDPLLDRYRLRWNVAGGGNATEIKDRIANSEEQSEPYYKAIAARGVAAATQALHAVGRPADLEALAAMLDHPDENLKTALKDANPERFERDIAWLEGLGDSEKSGLRGMGLRLHGMYTADGGEWLLPHPKGREINLYEAIKRGWLVVFTLPQGSYPELIPRVTRYIVSAANAVVGRLEREGRTVQSVLFVDELSAFDGDQLCSTLERARSAGIRCLLSTQSLSNFEDVGGTKLLHAALDNSELIVIHRQAVPDAADLLAGIAGTEEAWEHTHKVDDARSFHIGMDEVGERARRLSDRFRVHPNTIKQLARGEAILISQRPHFAATRIDVDTGLSARRHGASQPPPPRPRYEDDEQKTRAGLPRPPRAIISGLRGANVKRASTASCGDEVQQRSERDRTLGAHLQTSRMRSGDDVQTERLQIAAEADSDAGRLRPCRRFPAIPDTTSQQHSSRKCSTEGAR
jgi:hypothetical protein